MGAYIIGCVMYAPMVEVHGCVHDWMRAYVCCDVHDKIQTCPSRILTHAHAPTLWHTNPMPMQACSRAQRAETQEDCHLPADVMAWR